MRTYVTNITLQLLGQPKQKVFDFLLQPKDAQYGLWGRTYPDNGYSIPIRFTQLTEFMQRAEAIRAWCGETPDAEEPMVERIPNTTSQDLFCCRLRFMTYHGYFQFKLRWT